MKNLLLPVVSTLILSQPTMALAGTEDIDMGGIKAMLIEGLIATDNDLKPERWTYRAADGRVFTIDYELQKVKDLRPWAKRHPVATKRCKKVRTFCHFWLAPVQFMGSVAQFTMLFVR